MPHLKLMIDWMLMNLKITVSSFSARAYAKALETSSLGLCSLGMSKIVISISEPNSLASKI